jgi:Na+-transporting methylmalonyl-CoA/oxaloacetate decarboxylase gamma subunit
MKFVGAIIIVALFLLGLFLFANWETMTTPTQLSFLFFNAKISFGLMFLGITLVFAVLFISYILMLRTSVLIDAHRHAQELHAQRMLAESAETSRFGQLREQISFELARLHTENQDFHISLMARNDEIEQSLRKSLEEATNTLSASMGEMEEKLDRALERIAN